MCLYTDRFEKSKNGNIARRIQLKCRTQDTFHSVTLQSRNLEKAEHRGRHVVPGLPISRSACWGRVAAFVPRLVRYEQRGLGCQVAGGGGWGTKQPGRSLGQCICQSDRQPRPTPRQSPAHQDGRTCELQGL